MGTNKRGYMQKYWATHPDKYKEHKKRMKENNSKWRKENKEEARLHSSSASNKSRQKLKNEIFDLLGNRCVCCGFSDVRALQIDHVKGNGNQEIKRFKNVYQYYKNILDKLRSGSKDYQLLCANHNWIKRFENNEGPNRKLYKAGRVTK